MVTTTSTDFKTVKMPKYVEDSAVTVDECTVTIDLVYSAPGPYSSTNIRESTTPKPHYMLPEPSHPSLAANPNR